MGDAMTFMTHDVQDVALRQLETALRLYFESEDYYSVITLAGASEEIFGKLLGENNVKNALKSSQNDTWKLVEIEQKAFEKHSHKDMSDEEKTGLRKVIQEALCGGELGDDEIGTEDAVKKDVAELANCVRNKLKHGSPDKSKVIEFDAQMEAENMLNRAIDNYNSLTGQFSDSMRRFQDSLYS